jgi:hypothetical protein
LLWIWVLLVFFVNQWMEPHYWMQWIGRCVSSVAYVL